MNQNLTIARSELILGGQRSGKSRRAEQLACAWLASDPTHQATLIATAQPADEEMRLRIARHQADRAQRVPGMALVEAPLDLAEAMAQHSRPHTLLVVDCLTLWLTQLMMPAHEFKQNRPLEHDYCLRAASLLIAIKTAPGPVVLVGNEIGMGVVPMGEAVRAFVDALGRLNQDVAAACARVTLMAAGLPLTLKDVPC
jgi:adenosylcobinamide kinase/adenosylcobinamide-phosphate guanylyltransferase